MGQAGSRIGAGEILLTSMDADGTKQGFDIALCKAVRDIVDVPVIASVVVAAYSILLKFLMKMPQMPHWLPACFIMVK